MYKFLEKNNKKLHFNKNHYFKNHFLFKMQYVDPYYVSSDDESDVVLAVYADSQVGCRQCDPAHADSHSIVVVECNDCLSTPGKNDCICAPVSLSRRAGLDNDDWVATQNYQEDEFRQGLLQMRLKRDVAAPLVEQDIWMQEVPSGKWSLLSRSESSVVDLAKYLKRKFDKNVWSLIAAYFNSSYYATGKKHFPFFNELKLYYRVDVASWNRLQNQTAFLAYAAPMRGKKLHPKNDLPALIAVFAFRAGYCMRCGEPAINGRCASGLARTFASQGLVKTRTMKYGLGVMGICHRCNITGFQFDIYTQTVLTDAILRQRGSLTF
jgi:hypothetical protein